jgi:hypothetical protein
VSEDVQRADVPELFRAVNERIQELANLSVNGVFDFVCECGDDACTEVMRLTEQEFADAHSQPGSFAVLPGHENHLHDQLVLRTPRYHLVRSRGSTVQQH